MSFKCGIVGLPNVGKSTIFNVITNTANAQSANYPFCTIEPNVGRVAVADKRLMELQKIVSSRRIVPNYIDILDIAGLVRGANKGEGLGNQFLANIREVDAILHVVRAFEDSDISHVEDSVDPIRDIGIIETELLLADLAIVTKRLASIEKKVKTGDKEATAEHGALQKAMKALDMGTLLRFVDFDSEQLSVINKLSLLTAKPVLYIANVNDNVGPDNALLDRITEYAQNRGANTVRICAKLESEMIDFDEEDKKSFLVESGFADTGLGQVVAGGYSLLNLVTFFTAGEQEVRAWSVSKNNTAPVAAGVIHSDFEKHFIKAEVVGYSDFIHHKGVFGAKEAGKMRLEGAEYVVKDGDVIHFRVGV